MLIKDVELFKDGLKTIAEGFMMLSETIDTQVNEPVENVEEPEIKPEVEQEVEEEQLPKEEVTEDLPEEEVIELNKEHLETLGYRDLQKVAKDLDIPANGKKEEIIERILGEPVEEVVESAEEVLEEEVAEELKEELDLEVEEVEPSKADKIAKSLEEYTEEDLADVLNSVGVSPKGKRQALLSKIIKAIEEGKIEFELDEVEEEVEENIQSNMNEVRQHGVNEILKELDEVFKNDEMSEEEINTTLSNVYTEEDGYSDKLPLEEKKEMLRDVYMNLVDDEGNLHDLGEPYVKDEKYACCSLELEELEDGNLHCNICNQTYEIG